MISLIKTKVSFKLLILFSICCALFDNAIAQCASNIFYNKISLIDSDTINSPAIKLKQAYILKQQADSCKIPHDSVYAKILHRIGALEYASTNYDTAIAYTLEAAKINTNNLKTSSKKNAVNSYGNLGIFYDDAMQTDKSIEYFDKAIQLAESIGYTSQNIFKYRLDKNVLVFKKGDYQKSIEDNLLNLEAAKKAINDYFVACFFNRLSQAYYFQNQVLLSKKFADSGYFYAKKNNDLFEEGTSVKLQALTSSNNNLFSTLSEREIQLRIQSNSLDDLAGDYIDFGNFFLNRYKNYAKAKEFYFKSKYFAFKANDDEKIAIAYLNLGAVSFYQHNYDEAQHYYLSAFQSLKLNGDFNKNFLLNPSAKQLFAIIHKEFILVLLSNKTELLLSMYRKNNEKSYLDASLATNLLADSLITQTRHEQLFDQSKLYWRERTHEFFCNAIETSFLSKNSERVFYFMEKSRSVLLNDKLNELNASHFLLKTDAIQEENYEINITELQQKLAASADTAKQYQQIQLQLVNAKAEFERFISTLEQKYPVYYQYKYEDSVPSLKEFQTYLSKNQQSFVHYFVGDTATYILGITPTSTKLIRLSEKEFNKDQLAQFLQLCANKKELNNHYDVFTSLSSSIYTTIFQPLNLPKGRTIICMDNIVIPFEALCTDAKGKNFLLNDYSFDYVYSARFLMKQFNNPPAEGNFAGFAPVSFNSNLRVAALTNAATALKSSSSFYSNDKLFTHENATRNNFFSYASSYSIVNIFSHAKADTTDNEPVLYMQDSIIHLSELQRLNNPATKFVLLSACQTNVGKTATGEGIYSLARGFAAAGIPSVSATLWNADEETIYAISKSFNQYLSEGMNKDEALQKAKLDFIQNNDKDKMLPYYWANMILIGNADAVEFSSHHNYTFLWVVIAGIVVLICAIILLRRRNKASTTYG